MVLGTTNGDQEAWLSLCACEVGCWSTCRSRAKIRWSQVVKAILKRSKILTTVTALDTAPMGVPPPLALRHRIPQEVDNSSIYGADLSKLLDI